MSHSVELSVSRREGVTKSSERISIGMVSERRNRTANALFTRLKWLISLSTSSDFRMIRLTAFNSFTEGESYSGKPAPVRSLVQLHFLLLFGVCINLLTRAAHVAPLLSKWRRITQAKVLHVRMPVKSFSIVKS